MTREVGVILQRGNRFGLELVEGGKHGLCAVVSTSTQTEEEYSSAISSGLLFRCCQLGNLSELVTKHLYRIKLHVIVIIVMMVIRRG